MDAFEPIPDFFHKRQAKILNDRAADVDMVNERFESSRGRFVFPGKDYRADIKVGGQRAGYVDYGVNPLGDRLYINMLDIKPAHQQQGVGTSVLWQLWLSHRLPIVPISQYGDATGFWSCVRARFAAAGALIEAELRTSELDEAKQRWQHLVPETENDRSIREYWEWVGNENAAGRPARPGIR